MLLNKNEQASAKLVNIYEKLVSVQAMADDIKNSSDICSNHKAFFLIWYGKTLSEIKEEFYEITEDVL